MSAHSPWFTVEDITDWSPPKAEKFSDVYADYEPDFIIGDIVSLIVGGPDMVVIAICECGTVEVAWADSDGDVCIDVFPEEALVYA